MKYNLICKSLCPNKNHNIIVCANFDEEKEVFNLPFNSDKFMKTKVDIGVWKIKSLKPTKN